MYPTSRDSDAFLLLAPNRTRFFEVREERMMSHWARFEDCTQKRQDFVAARQQALALLGFSAKPRDFRPGSIGCSRRIEGT
jgi:hypothetical protein